MTATPNQEALDQLKRNAKATWRSGDYQAVARHLFDVGRRIVHRTRVRPGDSVLDVACGTGNAAIPAAVAGGHVVGVDLTPELFDAARKEAAAASVEIDWREGDAEALPTDDATFDVVLSTFGCMFAPRHQVAADELVRVLRPEGRLGLCNWTPEGSIGRFFEVLGRYLPTPPPVASPPLLWGTEPHVRQLLDGSDIQLSFDREIVELAFASPLDVLEFYAASFGPIIRAREALEPQGRWAALRDDLLAFFEHETHPRDGGVVWPAEYLVVVGRKL